MWFSMVSSTSLSILYSLKVQCIVISHINFDLPPMQTLSFFLSPLCHLTFASVIINTSAKGSLDFSGEERIDDTQLLAYW